MSAKSDQKQSFSANQKWGKQIVNKNENGNWELAFWEVKISAKQIKLATFSILIQPPSSTTRLEQN